MHEQIPRNPSAPEEKYNELDQLLSSAEQAAEAGAGEPRVTNFLIEMASHVQEIPGDDSGEGRYYFINGNREGPKEEIDPSLAERLLRFRTSRLTLGSYAKVEQKTYKNGAKHVYGIDDQGRRHHLSNDRILEYYGYANGQGGQQNTETQPQPQRDANETTGQRETGGKGQVPETDFNHDEEIDLTPPEAGPEEVDYTGHAAQPEEVDYSGRAADEEIDFTAGNNEVDYSEDAMEDALLARLTPQQREAVRNSFDIDLLMDLAYAQKRYTELAASREQRTVTAGAHSRATVETARRKYEQLRRQAQEMMLSKLEAGGYSRETLQVIAEVDDKTEARTIAAAMKWNMEDGAGPKGLLARQRAWFYDKWASWGGGDTFFSRKRLVGTMKKSAVMAAIGLPVGVAAGAAGVMLLGPIAGAAVAAGAARGVSRSLMRQHINQRAGNATIGGAQVERRLHEQNDRLDTYHEEHRSGAGVRGTYNVTDAFAEGTERSVTRNRMRTIGSAAIGAVAGAVGAKFLGDSLHDLWSKNSPSVPHGITTQPPKMPPVGPASPEHGVTGESFMVEPGSGIEREIQEYAASHGYDVTPQQASAVYSNLHDQFGRNIIDLKGRDTYMVGSDVRLTHPDDSAHWYPGVEAMMRRLLEEEDKTP